MELCFATNNVNKIKEVQSLIGDSVRLLGLKDIGCTEELAEDQTTLSGNALQKAKYIYETYHVNCFADDTGLIVEALNGAPGVYSARYAGPQKSNVDNINLLLTNLREKENRSASFTTVICAIIDGEEYFFEGTVYGEILEDKTGLDGFGYDPVFKPNGFDRSFAEMSLIEKNKISHRGRAFRKYIDFLNTNFIKG